MVARSTHASETTRPPLDQEHLRPAREAAKDLRRLLDVLFNDPPSLDIVTVEDIQQRYRLTGLGAPALAAIEQSQRIIRARGDYNQVGLAEFHIGLIYLHWGDCRAAAGQFAVARQPWTLVGDVPALCLAHYAQGLGLYHAYHNESAMLRFSRVERMLEHPPTGTHAERFGRLSDELRPLLTITQRVLRDILWPMEQQAAEPQLGGQAERPTEVPPPAGEPGTEPATEAELAPDPMPSTTDQPISRPQWAKRVPPPISNLSGVLSESLRGPVPGHITADDRFGWYMIGDNKGDFLPSLSSGTWLLADRDVDEHRSSGREYVVIGSTRSDLGSVVVQPVSHSSAMPYCYLGYRVADEAAPENSRVFLDGTNEPLGAGDALVLAVVEGFWYGLNGHALPDTG